MWMERPLDAEDSKVVWDTVGFLARGVGRCIEAGRFHAANATDLATRLWALTHGVITLEIAQLFTTHQALACLGGAALDLFTSFGDDREASVRSLGAALGRAGIPGAQQ